MHNPLRCRPLNWSKSPALALLDLVILRLAPQFLLIPMTLMSAMMSDSGTKLAGTVAVWTMLMFACMDVAVVLSNGRTLGFCLSWIVVIFTILLTVFPDFNEKGRWLAPTYTILNWVVIAVLGDIWFHLLGGLLEKCLGYDPIESLFGCCLCPVARHRADSALVPTGTETDTIPAIEFQDQVA